MENQSWQPAKNRVGAGGGPPVDLRRVEDLQRLLVAGEALPWHAVSRVAAVAPQAVFESKAFEALLKDYDTPELLEKPIPAEAVAGLLLLASRQEAPLAWLELLAKHASRFELAAVAALNPGMSEEGRRTFIQRCRESAFEPTADWLSSRAELYEAFFEAEHIPEQEKAMLARADIEARTAWLASSASPDEVVKAELELVLLAREGEFEHLIARGGAADEAVAQELLDVFGEAAAVPLARHHKSRAVLERIHAEWGGVEGVAVGLVLNEAVDQMIRLQVLDAADPVVKRMAVRAGTAPKWWVLDEAAAASSAFEALAVIESHLDHSESEAASPALGLLTVAVHARVWGAGFIDALKAGLELPGDLFMQPYSFDDSIYGLGAGPAGRFNQRWREAVGYDAEKTAQRVAAGDEEWVAKSADVVFMALDPHTSEDDLTALAGAVGKDAVHVARALLSRPDVPAGVVKALATNESEEVRDAVVRSEATNAELLAQTVQGDRSYQVRLRATKELVRFLLKELKEASAAYMSREARNERLRAEARQALAGSKGAAWLVVRELPFTALEITKGLGLSDEHAWWVKLELDKQGFRCLSDGAFLPPNLKVEDRGQQVKHLTLQALQLLGEREVGPGDLAMVTGLSAAQTSGALNSLARAKEGVIRVRRACFMLEPKSAKRKLKRYESGQAHRAGRPRNVRRRGQSRNQASSASSLPF